jgi:hypothetical protein
MKASLENVEKVVNPPQIPIVRNILHSGDKIFPFSESPKTTPIIKLPTIFIIKVPHGKTETYAT